MTRCTSKLPLDVLIQGILLLLSGLDWLLMRYFRVLIQVFNGLPLEPTKSILVILDVVYPVSVVYQFAQLLFMVFVTNSKVHQWMFILLVILSVRLFLWTSGFQDFFHTAGFFNVLVLMLCSTGYLLFNYVYYQYQPLPKTPNDALLDDDLTN